MKNLENGMVLYHGSYCVVETPYLEKCAAFKDFGRGFYLTTSKEQAKSFAKASATKAKSRGIIPYDEKFAYISFFKVDNIDDLKSFAFKTADVDWLHCIVAHRKDGSFSEVRKSMQDYDVISGKIANDDTNATIIAYMGNVFGAMGSEQADKMCISLLLPERLKDQFCFRSDKAISKLEFLKSEKGCFGLGGIIMSNEKTVFSMDLTALMVVEQLAKETNQPMEKVLLDFMESNTAKMLYDDSTKLWWDGPSATAEEFKKQAKEKE